jgi:cytochrome c oxidase cbb3-type subunit I/II
MADPSSTSPSSIMPRYPWLHTTMLDTSLTAGKIRAMQTMGVPYPTGFDLVAVAEMHKQAVVIYDELVQQQDQLLIGEEGLHPDHEIIALIAYLQRLGTDIEVKPAQQAQK